MKVFDMLHAAVQHCQDVFLRTEIVKQILILILLCLFFYFLFIFVGHSQSKPYGEGRIESVGSSDGSRGEQRRIEKGIRYQDQYV